MKTLKSHKTILATAIGALVALGMSANALAVPQFQVDPNSDGVYSDSFYATSIKGSSSERLYADNTLKTLSTSLGYLRLSDFTNDGPLGYTGGYSSADTGLNLNYGLYVTYNLVAQYVGGGAFGATGSNYILSALNFSVFRNDDFASLATRTKFTAATTAADASVTDVGGNDVLVGSGSLVYGVAGFNALGGAYLNSITTYANTAAGDAFFFDPSPFYKFAFNEFNNTTQGVTRSGNYIAVNSASGAVDFVPEPATVALMGLGLLGLGLSRRSKSA